MKKIERVKALPQFGLLIVFQNGGEKKYNIRQLYTIYPQFKELEHNEDLFSNVKVDVGGYGVYWNDELDIAADELWENGIETDIVHTLDIKKRFASRLIAMRDMLNMTQRELSEKTGIAQGDISKIENGNANPSLETIDRLIKGMNGEIDFVIKNQS